GEDDERGDERQRDERRQPGPDGGYHRREPVDDGPSVIVRRAHPAPWRAHRVPRDSAVVARQDRAIAKASGSRQRPATTSRRQSRNAGHQAWRSLDSAAGPAGTAHALPIWRQRYRGLNRRPLRPRVRPRFGRSRRRLVMKAKSLSWFALGALLTVGPLAAWGHAQKQAPTVKIPEPGVPQLMTIEGTWVRAAYNNEGYAILGYRLANLSIGDEWMLLEFGTPLRDGVSNYTLKRDALSLETHDGTTVPLATTIEYREANLSALQAREKVQRDSINYFPPNSTRAPSPGTGRAQSPARVRRPPVFQGAGRHHLRPVLAQREIREEPRARAFPDPDQGGREAAVQELLRHPQAGAGGVQAEE